MPDQTEEAKSPISFGRVNFPLSVVILVIAATAFLHNSLGTIRTDLAVMGARIEERDDFYRTEIAEIKKQIKALEYVVNEVQRSVETGKGK